MPASFSLPTFKATLPEWRTVLDALRYYEGHLTITAPTIEDEDDHLIANDDLERLDRIIPNFERQFDQHMEQGAESSDKPVLASSDR